MNFIALLWSFQLFAPTELVSGFFLKNCPK